MQISFDLDPDDLAESFIDMRQSDLLDLIATIDLRMADVGFTESLLKRLAKSIRTDLTQVEYAVLITALARIGADA